MRVGTARIGVPGLNPSAATLEGLVAEHGNRIYQLAYRLTRSPDDAEDILQDVFLKLYSNWAAVSSCDNLAAWITRVVTNASIDLLRSRRPRRSVASTEALAGPSGRVEAPSRAIEAREFDEMLKKALDRLPAREMAALVLFDHEGIKSREVGRILGITEGAVRRYVFEARRKVKTMLAPYFKGDQP